MDIRKKWEALSEFNENATVTFKGSNRLPNETINTLMKTVGDNSTISQNINIASSNYELLSKIAQGGMGIVFKGLQTNLQRSVAVKQSISKDKNLEGKFVAESVMTAYLDHPNIVPVHDLGRNKDGHVFMAMKLVGGVEWKDIIHANDDKVYSLEKNLRTLLNVCNAVAFAHSKGIVHNDLKPSNVMIGQFGEVLVMDWGIAVDIEPTPRANMLHKLCVDDPMGTPAYMPYELANGQGADIGPWTDTYLLGGILYEILMKQPPHSGTPLEAIMSCSLGKTPHYDENIPRELRNICSKALRKNIDERYANVAEFIEDVEVFLQHRESLVLTKKADDLHEEIDEYLQQQKQNRLFFGKFKYIFFDVPGKMLFPYCWYYSGVWGKLIFLVYMLIGAISSYYAFDRDIFSVIFGGIPFWFIISNILFVTWQVVRALCFRKEIGVQRTRLTATNRDYLYFNLIKIITLYERSIEIWEDNQNAKEKKQYMHAKFADIALNFKDSGLAETHLQVLKDLKTPYINEIRDRLIRTKIEQKSDRLALTISKFFMAGLVYISIGTIIIVLINKDFFATAFMTQDEETAVSLLSSYYEKQRQFRSEKHCDQNKNGVGEYGFLQELAGIINIRGKQESLNPPLINEKFKNKVLIYQGYCFYCYLPGANNAMSESNIKVLEETKSAVSLQEKYFVIYAWPQKNKQTSNRIFAINESGMILGAYSHYYSEKNIPEANAAYSKDSERMDLLGTWEVGTGLDDNEWSKIPTIK
ncbi:serine/threonine protein kinase [Candidatus Uabimicrobium sp. HlEnr_7]|uniref:serine/threonine protein kinase n=1 Tax=Candidatus Uabimicrobium helgolandensis TaxID=3095367 RepID=UPI0035591CA4